MKSFSHTGLAPVAFVGLIGLVGALNATPARASGSASSASSDAASASVGSVSTSFQASSNSSTGDKPVASGEYRLIEVAESSDRPDALRLKLQAVPGSGAAGEFFLQVPRATVESHQLAAGQLVQAQARPYGVEFARGEPRQAFFLLVDDAWYRELRTTAVTL